MSHILVADDSPEMCEIIRTMLERRGHSVEAVPSGEAALDQLKNRSFDLLITDLRMPGMDGMAVLRRVRELSPATMVIVITAYGTVENAVEAMRQGAFDYVLKPFSADEIELKIGRALERRRLIEERHLLRESTAKETGRLLCLSPAMQEVGRRIDAVAPLADPVLLTGGSGSGKSVAARELHRRSPRSGGPYIAINCVALESPAIDVEIFGAEKGAAPGILEHRRGNLELAEGGTLFLEEIAAMGSATQARLIDFLREGAFRRLGGRDLIRADVRLIASSSDDLDAAVARGGFQPELLTLLGTCTVAMPPLRERAEDIPALAEHFLQRYTAQLHKPVTLAAEAMGMLESYSWPGNAHELEHAIAQAVLSVAGDEIRAADLPATVSGLFAGVRPAIQEKPGVAGKLVAMEKEMLREALTRANGNLSKAAAALGMKRTTLQYKAKKYGITATPVRRRSRSPRG